jgi:hypothetical protein
MPGDSRAARLSRHIILKGAGTLIAASAHPSLGNAEQRVVINDASRLNPPPSRFILRSARIRKPTSSRGCARIKNRRGG